MLSIEQELGNNVYKAKLTVQAARPIYSTTYDSPIMNFLDDNVTFRYVEFQPVEFNETVSGNDPLAGNITAVLAYYVNLILGLITALFQYVVVMYIFRSLEYCNAPESSQISGWKSFESLRNRYWLAENLNNNRFALMHDALYSYYRNGMDLFYENEDAGRNGILNCLNFLNYCQYGKSQFYGDAVFFSEKSNELVKVFSKAGAEQKNRARNYLPGLM